MGGLKGKVAVWRLSRPGRDHDTLDMNLEGKAGIVSAMDVAPDGKVLAAGTFSSIVCVCDLRSYETVAWLRGHTTGVTQVHFSRCVAMLTVRLEQANPRLFRSTTTHSFRQGCCCSCGNFLYSRARKDSHILCWDVRNTLSCLYTLQVPDTFTNQRLAFCIEPCGRHMLAGGSQGTVAVFDLATGEAVQMLKAASDTVSGVSMHQTLPIIATCSGHRRFWDECEQCWDDQLVEACNTVRLWHVRNASL